MNNAYNLETSINNRSYSVGLNSDELTPPAKIPAAPTPPIALPTMKATELGAAPQRTEETSNNRIHKRRQSFTGKNL